MTETDELVTRARAIKQRMEELAADMRQLHNDGMSLTFAFGPTPTGIGLLQFEAQRRVKLD